MHLTASDSQNTIRLEVAPDFLSEGELLKITSASVLALGVLCLRDVRGSEAHSQSAAAGTASYHISVLSKNTTIMKFEKRLVTVVR